MKPIPALIFLLLGCTLFSSVSAQPPERKGRTEGQSKSSRPRRGEAVERYFKRLQEQDPDEVTRLRELRRTDPQAFRAEMRNRLQRKGPNHRMERLTEDHSIQELVKNLKYAPNEEAYAASMEQLRQKVSERYDQSLAAREQALISLREKLVALETKHEREKGKRDRIIERQMERLLQEERPAQPPASERPPQG